MDNLNYISLNVKSIESEIESFNLKQLDKVERLSKGGRVVYKGHLYEVESSDREDLPFIIIENPIRKMV